MNSSLAQRNKREIFAWTLYDFANTSFSVIIVTVVYAVYFKQYVISQHVISLFGFERNPGDLYWGLGGAISMLFVGLTSPIIGAIADSTNSKKVFLFIYSLICIAATIALYVVQPGMIGLGLLLFIIGNIGFEGGIVFYNGFLPQISEPETIGKISGYGFAFGYVGSLFSLLIALPYANQAFEVNDLALMRPTFVWAGLFFLFFSLPIFFFVRETRIPQRYQLAQLLSEGLRRTTATIKRMREFPEIIKFLIAYFVYIDGVNTIIYFSGIYASDTFGFSMKEVIQFFTIAQSSAITGAFVFGFMTDKLGPKKTINITLFLWIIVSVTGFLAQSKTMFYVVGLIAGVAMGSSQSASRALMGKLIPEGMEAEFYGFYALTGKFSAILGPLTFGLTSTITNSQRTAVLSVMLFFIIGYLLLRRVDETITYKKIII